eukprot:649529-Prorocentrum_minimum.AAC.1
MAQPKLTLKIGSRAAIQQTVGNNSSNKMRGFTRFRAPFKGAQIALLKTAFELTDFIRAYSAGRVSHHPAQSIPALRTPVHGDHRVVTVTVRDYALGLHALEDGDGFAPTVCTLACRDDGRVHAHVRPHLLLLTPEDRSKGIASSRHGA